MDFYILYIRTGSVDSIWTSLLEYVGEVGLITYVFSTIFLLWNCVGMGFTLYAGDSWLPCRVECTAFVRFPVSSRTPTLRFVSAPILVWPYVGGPRSLSLLRIREVFWFRTYLLVPVGCVK